MDTSYLGIQQTGSAVCFVVDANTGPANTTSLRNSTGAATVCADL